MLPTAREPAACTVKQFDPAGLNPVGVAVLTSHDIVNSYGVPTGGVRGGGKPLYCDRKISPTDCQVTSVAAEARLGTSRQAASRVTGLSTSISPQGVR